MEMSLSQEELYFYLSRQLEFFFPDGYSPPKNILKKSIHEGLERCENCFRHIKVHGYNNNAGVLFSHLHMDQYATFLYFTSNTLWKKYGEKQACDKIMNLQKVLNGLVLSYKCPMPDIFMLAHPVGSVIGNANYSDGLYISQNVTINTHVNENNKLDLYIGKGVMLCTGAKIIGNKPIGDRVSIGADVLVYNRQIENDKVVVNSAEGILVRDRTSKMCKCSLVFDLDF